MRNDEEEGDTPLTAQTISVNGVAVEGALLAADDYNWYKFTAPEAGEYAISTYAEDADQFDTYLMLFSDGILVDYSDIIFGSDEFWDTYYDILSYMADDDDSGFWGYNSQITATLEEGETYYLLVVDYDYPDGYVFDYSIDVTTVE